MKKVMFLLAVAGMFSFAACNNNAAEAPAEEAVVEETVAEEAVVEEEVVERAAEGKNGEVRSVVASTVSYHPLY